MAAIFEFIRNLKVGVWTNIERSWLKKLQKHLTQADKLGNLSLLNCIVIGRVQQNILPCKNTRSLPEKIHNLEYVI